MLYSIYIITNVLTNKSYIGMTKRTIEKRLASHLYEARTEKYSMYLHRSMRFHGPDVFIIELLEQCTAESVGGREQFWIRHRNTVQPYGYNQHSGGLGGCLNPSVELRAKLRAAKIGKKPWNAGYTAEEIRLRREGMVCFFPLDRPRPKKQKYQKKLSGRLRWYHKGQIEAKLVENTAPPDWTAGRLPKQKGRAVRKRREGSWNKGKTKRNDEAVLKYSNALAERAKISPVWNKGLPNNSSAELGKASAEKQRLTIAGRKRFIREDGTWTWRYPDGTIGKRTK